MESNVGNTLPTITSQFLGSHQLQIPISSSSGNTYIASGNARQIAGNITEVHYHNVENQTSTREFRELLDRFSETIISKLSCVEESVRIVSSGSIRPLQDTLTSPDMRNFVRSQCMELDTSFPSRTPPGLSKQHDEIVTTRPPKRRNRRPLYQIRKPINLYGARVVLQLAIHEIRPFGESSTTMHEITCHFIITPSPQSIWFWSSGVAISSSWSLQTSESIRTMQYFPVRPGNSEIFQYAADGDITGIQRLLTNGEASVHDTTPDGCSVLHTAVLSGNADVVKLLLGLNANPNTTTYFSGIYPLLSVMVDKNQPYEIKMDIARALLGANADPTVQTLTDDYNLNCFTCKHHNSEKAGAPNMQLVESLYVMLAQHENVYFDPDEYRGSMTTLMLSSCLSGTFIKLKFDIEHSHNPNLRVLEGACKGWTAFHLFLYKRFWSLNEAQTSLLINLYIQKGFDLQATTDKGFTPTYLSLQNEDQTVFFLWREVLRSYQENSNLNIESFARTEIECCPFYSQQGWTLEALMYLLTELPSPNVDTMCSSCMEREYYIVKVELLDRCLSAVSEKMRESMFIEDNSFLFRIGDVYECPPLKNKPECWTSWEDDEFPPSFLSRFNAVQYPGRYYIQPFYWDPWNLRRSYDSSESSDFDTMSLDSDTFSIELDAFSLDGVPNLYNDPVSVLDDTSKSLGIISVTDDSPLGAQSYSASERDVSSESDNLQIRQIGHKCCGQRICFRCLCNSSTCQYGVHTRWAHSYYNCPTYCFLPCLLRTSALVGLGTILWEFPNSITKLVLIRHPFHATNLFGQERHFCPCTVCKFKVE